MRFAQDQYVVEELAAERSGEALGERVHVGSADGRPYDARADGLEDTLEARAELPVPVADEHFWCSVVVATNVVRSGAHGVEGRHERLSHLRPAVGG
jgi:hypothetical protein